MHLFARQPGLDHQLALELREANISIHLIGPGSQRTVQSHAEGQWQRCSTTAAVTSMNHGRHGRAPIEALGANLPFPHWNSGRAEQSIVVKRQDSRSTFANGMENGWRNKRKRIVNMHDVRFEAFYFTQQGGRCPWVPRCRQCALYCPPTTLYTNFIAVTNKLRDHTGVRLEQFFFRFENLTFT
ncbi:hypothetical protein D9M70_384170 [compost metagenome]